MHSNAKNYYRYFQNCYLQLGKEFLDYVSSNISTATLKTLLCSLRERYSQCYEAIQMSHTLQQLKCLRILNQFI